jgi:adenosylmethionine-8-amino-7-oxononanoate aminotransferase
MTTSIEHPPAGVPDVTAARAADHLWMHFARQGRHPETPVPVITRGEGAYIWDNQGRKILDGLSGLFVVQVGHGRRELAEVAARQAAELAYFPVWGYTTPVQAELAERIAGLAPGDLNRVFFTTGGGEAVESAWKAAKQYFKLIGKPQKHKVISRAVAYHGTPPNTNLYRHPEFADDPKAFGRWAADRIEEAILFEGADTVAAVFLEPVQNSGGCLTPPPGYFERVREICDRHDVLLVSDEVICAFGRHGATFACEKFGYTPDLITCAKGMSSGYGPIGAMIASEKVIEPFLRPGVAFPHGYTFGGHPVAAAVSLANLPIVGDVRGDGYFWAVELVKDKATRETFDAAERERLIRGFLPGALFDNGLYCRPDDRGDVVVQVAPPLICGQAEFDEMEQILRHTLTEAQDLV